MWRKIFIVIIIAAVIASVGCQKENSSLDYSFSTHDLQAKFTASIEINSVPQFESQLREFNQFSQEFFPLWSQYIMETEPLLEEFNGPGSTPKEKMVYAGQLRTKYEQLYQNLEKIIPPGIAEQAHRYALDIVGYRIIFLYKFEEGADAQTLSEISDTAYLLEEVFWLEIDKIFNIFDQAAKSLGINQKELELERL